MATEELQPFIADWKEDAAGMKAAFVRYQSFLAEKEGVTLDFKGRPGVSFSLRAVHANQKNRTLFVMVDVIDDDPENRWLSVCFYGDMVTDPEEKGDLVPGGLLGEDGYCFDLDAGDDPAYLEARIEDAFQAAVNG